MLLKCLPVPGVLRRALQSGGRRLKRRSTGSLTSSRASPSRSAQWPRPCSRCSPRPGTRAARPSLRNQVHSPTHRAALLLPAWTVLTRTLPRLASNVGSLARILVSLVPPRPGPKFPPGYLGLWSVTTTYLTVLWGHPSLKVSLVVLLLGSRPSPIRLPLLSRTRLLGVRRPPRRGGGSCTGLRLLRVLLLLSPRRRVCMLPLLPPLVLLARLRRVRRSFWLPGMTRNFFVSLLRMDANCGDSWPSGIACPWICSTLTWPMSGV